jgi:ribosomal protein S18 acetylase RimI-like enzyme
MILDKSQIQIFVTGIAELELRAAREHNLENLRQWKNQNKQFFFHQEDITPEQQKSWWEAFMERPLDLVFMTVFEGNEIGCMGIRWLDGYWDIYNVILGNSLYRKHGLMGRAFDSLLNYALSVRQAPVQLQVLKHNPAVGWYQKHGFFIEEEYITYYKMTYQVTSTQSNINS